MTTEERERNALHREHKTKITFAKMMLQMPDDTAAIMEFRQIVMNYLRMKRNEERPE